MRRGPRYGRGSDYEHPTIAVLIITPLMLVAEQCSENSSGHGFNRAEKGGSHLEYRSAEGRSGAVGAATRIKMDFSALLSFHLAKMTLELMILPRSGFACAWAYCSNVGIIFRNVTGTTEVVP